MNALQATLDAANNLHFAGTNAADRERHGMTPLAAGQLQVSLMVSRAYYIDGKFTLSLECNPFTTSGARILWSHTSDIREAMAVHGRTAAMLVATLRPRVFLQRTHVVASLPNIIFWQRCSLPPVTPGEMSLVAPSYALRDAWRAANPGAQLYSAARHMADLDSFALLDWPVLKRMSAAPWRAVCVRAVADWDALVASDALICEVLRRRCGLAQHTASGWLLPAAGSVDERDAQILNCHDESIPKLQMT